MYKHKERHAFPIPKGNSPYAQAKRAEYVDKDIRLAKRLYEEAIHSGDRAESAVKDLASLLHQEGNTQEACDLLVTYQSIFTDYQKFQNLLSNLREKLVPTGKCLYKQIKLSPIAENCTEYEIQKLFRDPSRITAINIHDGYAILSFSSHSAARKTLQTFCKASRIRTEWVYETRTLERFPKPDMETAVLLLGRELMAELFWDLNVAALPFVPTSVPNSVTI